MNKEPLVLFALVVFTIKMHSGCAFANQQFRKTSFNSIQQTTHEEDTAAAYDQVECIELFF